jgi:hypothetical protein
MVHSSPLWEKNLPIGKLSGVPGEGDMYCFLLSTSPFGERRRDLKRTVSTQIMKRHIIAGLLELPQPGRGV